MCRGAPPPRYMYYRFVGIHSLFGGCCGWRVGHSVCGRLHVQTELCNKNGGGEAGCSLPCLFDALEGNRPKVGRQPPVRAEHSARPVDRPVLVPPTLRTVQVQVAVTSCFQPTPQCFVFVCLFLLRNRGTSTISRLGCREHLPTFPCVLRRTTQLVYRHESFEVAVMIHDAAILCNTPWEQKGQCPQQIKQSFLLLSLPAKT